MRSLSLTVLVSLTLISPLWAVTCGETLGPGGVYTLTGNLDCFDSEGVAVVVRDGATLNLGGFTVVGGGGPAVILDGTAATLRGGWAYALGVVVVVGGTGRHHVLDLTIPDTVVEGVRVSSDDNVVERVHCLGGPWVGLVIDGEGNDIRENTAVGSELFIQVNGSGNRVRLNVSMEDSSGIFVHGNRNLIARNQMGEGGGVNRGYWVTGVGNILLWNAAPGVYDVDAEDRNGDCQRNRWIANQFETADPPCILGQPLATSRAE
jgi:hypothetical protein